MGTPPGMDWWKAGFKEMQREIGRSLRADRSGRSRKKAIMKPHAGEHGGDKNQGRFTAGPKSYKGRPRAKPRHAPTDTEEQTAQQQAAIDAAGRRQLDGLAGPATLSPGRAGKGDEAHGHRPAHDQGQAGVPGAPEIEKAFDLGRVAHAAEDEAQAE